MKKRWIDKDGNFWDGISIVIDGMRIWNPSDEQLIEAGYTEYIPPTPPEPTPEELLEMAKQEKIYDIEDYDRSDHVNSFTIDFGGGVTQDAWIMPEQRSNYKNSLDSAELLGLTEVHPVFNGQQLTLSLQMAKIALAQIQIYADRCYIVTETHKANVQALDSVEAVDAYDNEIGYPEKLTFPI